MCLKQLRGVIIETPMVIAMVYLCIQMKAASCAWLHGRNQGGQRGHGPPQIFRKYSHFVL